MVEQTPLDETERRRVREDGGASLRYQDRSIEKLSGAFLGY
jgi:hypothetical protein